MYILLNISRSEGNQTMKFGQGYGQNAQEKHAPDPSVKCKTYAYLWIDSLKCYTVIFILCSR